MAEDEDDDMFGDFKFVSYPNSNQNNDEDWGDFVATVSPKQDLFRNSNQFQPSNGFSITKNPSFDSLNITVDPPTKNLNHVESSKNLGSPWEKPKGALPLSIFGGEEDESDKDEQSNGVLESFSSKSVINGSNSGSGVSFNDLIVNLYGQQANNGSNSGHKEGNTEEMIKDENGSFAGDPNGKAENGSNSSLLEENGDFEEDDWEFKDAVPVNRDFDIKKDDNVFGSWLVQAETPISAEPTKATNTTTSSPKSMTPAKATESQFLETSEGSLFGFSNNAQVGCDWLTTSEGSSYNSNATDNGYHFDSGVSAANILNTNSFSDPTPVETENGNTNFLVNGSAKSNEIFGNFEEAHSKTEGSSHSHNAVDNGLYFHPGMSSANFWNPNLPSQRQPTPFTSENGNPTHFVNGNDELDEIFGDFEDAAPKIKGSSNSPHAVDNGFYCQSETSTANFWNPNLPSQPTPVASENGNPTHLVNGNDETDEIFGDFEDASQKSEALSSSSEQKGNAKLSENSRGALPLSIFGDDKLESDESSFGQEMFSFDSTPVNKGINKQISSSHISLNDLISDLYSQSEKVPTVGSTIERTENGFNPTQYGSSSNLASVEDDFDENSWEFKVASSETKAEHSSPVLGTLQNFPTEAMITSFVDFYSGLKEESSFIILHHLGELKSAQKLAALSGDDSKAKALHEEIQSAHKKLVQENIVSEDVLEEHMHRNVCLNELLAAMKEPKFLVLEQEYHLSQNISSAEKNLKSAIELFEHAISVLKILNLGSGEDLITYTTSWSKMMSACVEELKHGASIWTQSLQENVPTQILSKSQGQQYILALGEIYRVAEILRVSATLYKPWILSGLVNPMDIFASLEECRSLWSTSGLDEALQTLSNSVIIAKKLQESINFIRDLDLSTLSFQNNDTSPEHICRLSLSSSKTVPDVKMVTWNGEHYFAPLANFWANLVSSEPPNLPCIPVNT